MNIADSTSNLQEGLHYASLGYRVFPLHGFINGVCSCCRDCRKAGSKPGKHPACPHGCHEGTTDEANIRGWFDGKPWLNVGIALDAHYMGLDIDPRHGGDATLSAWEQEHGPLPATPRVRTGSGGDHLYFRIPPGVVVKNTAGKVAPGIDTRSLGGYLVAPPSVHESGGRYEWLVPLTTPLAMAPDWLLAIVGEPGAEAKPKAQAPGSAGGPGQGVRFGAVQDDGPCDFASHPGAGQGQRNDALCRLAGVHLARGDSLATIEALAVAWGKRCDPPCEPEGILRKVRDLAAKEARKRGETANERNNPPTPEAGELIRSQSSFARAESEGQEAEGPNPDPPPPFLSTLVLTSEAGADARGDEVGAGDAFTASPHANASAEGGAEGDAADDWPKLGPEAYHGLAGAIVRAIEPETEADPVAILLTLLTAFGNCVGKGPYFSMNAGTHHANVFSSIVGDTASAKGQSFGIVRNLMAKAEAQWEAEALAYGLSSGEGLVDRVKDDADADAFVSSERRLLAVETEFARPITAMRREGNTLSPLLRAAWDSQTLEVLTRGKSKLRASNAHVSILAHITPEELGKILGQSVEVANGFANRFLWALVKRSKSLPEGGDSGVIGPFVGPLAGAIATARGIGRVTRDDGAKALWAEVYEGLTEAKPGAYGLATSRGHAQTLRLSLIYALLDGSDAIRAEHLKAALAVWAYCERSARLIFGGQAGTGEGGGREAGDEPLDFRLLLLIEKAPGITRTGLHEATGRKVKASDMEAALTSLEARGLAHRRMLRSEGGGRPAEGWFPGPKPDGPDGGEAQADASGGAVGGFGFTVAAEASASAFADPPCEETPANELTPEGGVEGELIRSQSSFAVANDGGDGPTPGVNSFVRTFAEPNAGGEGPQPPPPPPSLSTQEPNAKGVQLTPFAPDAKGVGSTNTLSPDAIENVRESDINQPRPIATNDSRAIAEAEFFAGLGRESNDSAASTEGSGVAMDTTPAPWGDETMTTTQAQAHLNAVGEWAAVIRAKGVSPERAAALARHLYRSAWRTHPHRGCRQGDPRQTQPLDVPSWLAEETAADRLERVVQGGIERERRAKAQRDGEMGVGEFVAMLDADLSAIELANAEDEVGGV